MTDEIKMRKCLAGVIVGLATTCLSGAAYAQSTFSIGQIAAAANSGTDKSMAALQLVLGAIVSNPLIAVSGGGGLIGPMFLVLNGCLLAVGVILALYHFVKMVINTAQSGEFMGERKKSPWFVIKNIAGFVGLVPIFGGYSGAQVVMLWATMMGVGIANLTVGAALTALQAGGSMIATPVAGSATTLAKGLFEAYLCAAANNQAIADVTALSADLTPSATEAFSQKALPDPSRIGFTMQNGNGISCGGAALTIQNQDSPTLSSGGFANYTDATDNIAPAILAAHQAALAAMAATLQSKAQAYVAAIDGGTSPAENPAISIDSAALAYQQYIQSAVNNLAPTLGGLSTTIQSNLTRDGWIMAGAWYQTFAQANANANALTNAKATTLPPASTTQMPYATVYDAVLSRYTAQIEAANETVAPASGGSPSVAVLTQGSTDPEAVITGIFPGQSIVTGMIRLLNSNNGTTGTVNPLIGMKALGDRLLDAGSGILTLWLAERAYEGYSQHSLIGTAETAAEDIATVGTAGAGKAAVFSILDGIGPIICLFAASLFFFGVSLSIYIPMLPFIMWFSGVVTWFVVVSESLVAAPLWAITHLDGEADGLVGQRSAHGYIFLLNLLFRPVFMLIGFILAGAFLLVLGTLLNTMFGVALQNAQCSSVTGLVSIIAFLVIYVNMSTALVSQLFSLIHVIPDQVFAWVGGHAAPSVSQDMGGVVGGKLESGSRSTLGTIQTGLDKVDRNDRSREAMIARDRISGD